MTTSAIAPDTALLVVDVQALTLPNAVAVPAPELLDRIGALLEAWRAAGALVAFAVTSGMPAGATSYGAGPREWTAEQQVIAPDVAPLEGEPVVTRPGWSAFAETALASSLHDRGVTRVVIVGLATPFGIESTARAAYDLGFSVVVPGDAVSGPDASAHEWTLSRVIPLVGVVTSTEELLAG